MKQYLSRSQSRFWSTEFPVGDACAGPAFGERRDPGTIAIVSGVFSAIGSISQANAKSDDYNSQAAAATYNAQVTQQRAQTVLEAGNAEEDALRRRGRIALGSTRAALAQSGVGLEGSAGDVYQQSAANAELDALSTRYTSTLNAKGLRDQATLYEQQAENARRNAKSASTGGLLGAGAALASGFGNYKKLT